MGKHEKNPLAWKVTLRILSGLGAMIGSIVAQVIGGILLQWILSHIP